VGVVNQMFLNMFLKNNFLLVLLISSFFLVISCEKGAIEEAVDDSVGELPTFETDIPDSLAVYELVDGERRRSTSIRLLTNAERKKLIKKGVIWADDDVNLKAQNCEWKDTGATLECDDGAIDCGAAFVNGDLCLVCYGPASTIMNYGECR
jgi:hypothetical protein